MKIKLLASALLVFSFCTEAQFLGGPTQASRVVNNNCTSGQVPTFDVNKRMTGCASAGGGANVTATSASAVTSLALNISTLNVTSVGQVIVQCWSGAAAPFSPVTVTSLNPATTSSITANFASTANVTCRANASGGAGPAGATGPTGATGATGAAGANGTNGAISQIQDEGSNVTVRPTINFVGSGVAVTDDAGNNRSLVTISGGGGSITGCGFGQTLNGTVCDNNTAVMNTNANLQSGTPLLCSGSASTTATCTMSPTLTAYTTGMLVNFVAGATNTTTYTLNIDTLGAKSILSSTAGALSAGAITSGVSYILRYDGTQFRLPAAGGGVSRSIFNPLSDVPSWTTYHGTSLTINTSFSGRTLLSVASDTSGQTKGVYRTISAGFDQIFAISPIMRGMSGGNAAVGVFLTNGTANSTCAIQWQGGNNGFGFYAENWTNSTTFSGAITMSTNQPFGAAGLGVSAPRLAYFRLQSTGGNTVCSYSQDGYVWQQVWTRADGTFLTPTGAGVYVANFSGYAEQTAAVILGVN